MRQLCLPLLFLLLAASLAATTFTSKSLLFSDSYMLRAQGCDANYWNPALLNSETRDLWLPAVNVGLSLGNNSLSLELYNYIMERDYLDETDKQKILDAIDERIAINMGGQLGLFGFTMGDLAFSSSVHYAGSGAFSEQYIALLLNGFGETTDAYRFTHAHNYVNALSYLDFTLGMGDIRLPLPELIPDIRFGFAASLLAGIGDAGTREFDGYLASNLDGFTLRQYVRAQAALGGYGFKGLLGLYSEPIPNLTTGLTLNNLPGFLRWEFFRKEYSAFVEVDSLYISDFDEDLEELYTQDFRESDAAPYTTILAPELRFAALYKHRLGSLSLDLVKGFENAADVSRQLRFAVGLELTPLKMLPIHLGFGSGNAIYPWRVSYGLGFNFKVVQFGLGIQVIESLIPDYSTKGLAFGSYLNLRL